MYVEPGQGNAAHTQEVEECFVELEGELTMFVEESRAAASRRASGRWERVACPPGASHGNLNDSLEPVHFLTMLGRGRPEAMGYADDQLYARRDYIRRNPG